MGNNKLEKIVFWIIELSKLYIRVAGGLFIVLLLLTLWMPEPPEPMTLLEKVVRAFKASFLWPFEITDTQAFMLWYMIGVPFLIYGIGMWVKKEDIADMLVTVWFGWPLAIAIVGMALFYLVGLLFLASL